MTFTELFEETFGTFSATPDLLIEVGFDSGPTVPLGSTVWTDVSSFVRSFAIRRGRSSELDDFTAGTASLVFDNSDRRFDPEHASSPYSPNVLPMRRLRIRATHNAVTHNLFNGFVTGWPQTYAPPNYAEVTVRCVDAFEVLASTDLPESVWAIEVAADQTSTAIPEPWWRLNEAAGLAVASTTPGVVAGQWVNVVKAPNTGGLVPYSDDSAASFDGGHIEIAGIKAGGDFGTGVSCFEFWFSTTSTGGVNVIDLANRQVIRRIDINVGAVRYSQTFAGGQSTQTDDATFNDGVPHHVVVNIGHPATIFVDGVSQAVTTGTVTHNGSGDMVTIGSTVSGGFLFDGTIDEVALYDTALSAARVTAHYNAAIAPWDGDTSGARVGRILDEADWPTADRDVNSGQSILGPEPLGIDVLSSLKRVANAESGRLFISGDGKVTFLNRHHTFLDTAVTATWGETGSSGELPYFHAGFEFEFDRDQIRNAATGNRPGGSSLTVEDATSIAIFTRRDFNVGEVAVRSDSELLNRLEYTVDQYKDPLLRVGSIIVTPNKTPAGSDTWTSNGLWAAALGAEVGQRHVVKRHPQDVGAAISSTAILEGVEHRVNLTATDWTTVFYLSPADTTQYWILGTGELGDTSGLTNTRLGY